MNQDFTVQLLQRNLWRRPLWRRETQGLDICGNMYRDLMIPHLRSWNEEKVNRCTQYVAVWSKKEDLCCRLFSISLHLQTICQTVDWWTSKLFEITLTLTDRWSSEVSFFVRHDPHQLTQLVNSTVTPFHWLDSRFATTDTSWCLVTWEATYVFYVSVCLIWFNKDMKDHLCLCLLTFVTLVMNRYFMTNSCRKLKTVHLLFLVTVSSSFNQC